MPCSTDIQSDKAWLASLSRKGCRHGRKLYGRSHAQQQFARATLQQHDPSHTEEKGRLQRLVEQNTQQSEYTAMLLGLESAAAEATENVLSQSEVLTEPFIAYEVARTLPHGDGLFLGNSMPIRDADAFAGCAVQRESGSDAPRMTDIKHSFGARVAANRGASGIDGIISTAAGYAFGLKRATTLLIGDVSFLHDVNGLNLLRTSEMSPPLTIVLVNNGGGGIFDFLPIADEVPKETFNQLWTTPQNVALASICRAHGLPHQLVTQPEQLEPALQAARGLNKHSVVEVVTSREENVAQHRAIQAQIKAAVLQAFRTQSKQQEQQGVRITGMQIGRYNLPLRASLTTGATAPTRHGLVLELHIQDTVACTGFSGRGEISPLPGLHKETLEEAESQLRLLATLIAGQSLPPELAKNAESLNGWLENTVGLDAEALMPSVRCGLEMALLSAMASLKRMSLSDLLSSERDTGESASHHIKEDKQSVAFTPESSERRESWPRKDESAPPTCDESSVRGNESGAGSMVYVNSLADHRGEVDEAVAAICAQLRLSNCQTVKVKVGRERTPVEDARLLVRLRQELGPDINLRADANRAWSLSQALEFATGVRDAKLEYVEEPLKDPSGLNDLFQQTALPIALDETVDEDICTQPAADCEVAQADRGTLFEENLGELSTRLNGTHIAALILKPAVLGGLTRCMAIASVAQKHNVKVVISSAFESSLSLAAYSQLAYAIGDLQPGNQVVAHGLATAEWFASDVIGKPLQADSGISMDAAKSVSELPLVELNLEDMELFNPLVTTSQQVVHTPDGKFSFRVKRFGPWMGSRDPLEPPVLLLHGFMGCSDDWTPIVSGLSSDRECIVIDLPGHGGSLWQPKDHAGDLPYSLAAMARAVIVLLQLQGVSKGLTVVGYSMGARLGLKMLEMSPGLISDLILLSPSPQIAGEEAMRQRLEADCLSAERLRQDGLTAFLAAWYRAPMWGNLASHPRFEEMMERRKNGDALTLANILEGASSGRALNQWSLPGGTSARVSVLVGMLDRKCAEFARGYPEFLHTVSDRPVGPAFMPVTYACGSWHAVHIQTPLTVLNHIMKHIEKGIPSGL